MVKEDNWLCRSSKKGILLSRKFYLLSPTYLQLQLLDMKNNKQVSLLTNSIYFYIFAFTYSLNKYILSIHPEVQEGNSQHL